MAQLLHGSATTTARLRALFQASPEPATVLAQRHGVNPKTVQKWRRRDTVEDRPMGPHVRRSSTLSEREKAAVVAFRVQTRLPLDDVFLALRGSIPALTRSTLHRGLQRQGVSRLPRQARPRRGQCKQYEIGYCHVDIAEVRTARAVPYRIHTVHAFHYDSIHELRRHVTDYLAAYNVAKQLKALRWRTPYETREALWRGKPELFRLSPDHLAVGPNT